MRKDSLLVMILLGATSPAALAQSQSSQPVDPTAQAPSTVAPSTPQTFPPRVNQPDVGMIQLESATAGSSTQEAERSFVGTIMKRQHAYFLKTADAEYLLREDGEARKFKGKRVKITGRSNENHTILVRMIKLSPPK
jgi:hypothetical protein